MPFPYSRFHWSWHQLLFNFVLCWWVGGGWGKCFFSPILCLLLNQIVLDVLANVLNKIDNIQVTNVSLINLVVSTRTLFLLYIQYLMTRTTLYISIRHTVTKILMTHWWELISDPPHINSICLYACYRISEIIYSICHCGGAFSESWKSVFVVVVAPAVLDADTVYTSTSQPKYLLLICKVIPHWLHAIVKHFQKILFPCLEEIGLLCIVIFPYHTGNVVWTGANNGVK